jgi:glutamate N-acetyltransferase/amino-acid N-acetyltransferase
MTIPSGFQFSTAQCGFKRPGRSDLALVVSDTPAVAAGVFTTNLFQAAPVLVARDNLAASPDGIRAVVVNSGQANACTGQEGIDNCRTTLEFLGALGLAPGEILPASTGVIGDQLKMDLWEKGVPSLRDNLGRVGLVDAARAIMTTDTFPKLAFREVTLAGGVVRLSGFCKGAGMICPNMATMLGFILCDAAVESQWWQQALVRCVDKSFNAITVDGDTSTNDCILALANGTAAQAQGAADLEALEEALLEICQDLAYMIVQDAEGGTKVMRVNVAGAASMADAQLAARAVGNSPLVKTALYGRDPNWGRIVAASGVWSSFARAPRSRPTGTACWLRPCGGTWSTSTLTLEPARPA